MAHKLEDYPLHFELTENDDLRTKIKRLFRSFKLKPIKRGWLAQVRFKKNGERIEIAEIGNSPDEAVGRLDKRLESRGLYE